MTASLQIWDPVSMRWLPNLEESEEARVAAEARVAELEAEVRRLRGG